MPKRPKIHVDSELHSNGPTFTSISAALDYLRHELKQGRGATVWIEEDK